MESESSKQLAVYNENFFRLSAFCSLLAACFLAEASHSNSSDSFPKSLALVNKSIHVS